MLHLMPPWSGPLDRFPVTQPYGPTTFAAEPPGYGYPHFHYGTDFGLPMVTPVLAAAGGTVEAAGWDATGFGNRVILDHGLDDKGRSVATLYGHLAQLEVGLGARIAAGGAVGLSGSSGNSSGPHLHFGVRVDGVYVDPWPYLTAPPPPPPPPPPPVQEGPHYGLNVAMHMRPLPAIDAFPLGPLLPVGTRVVKTTNPPAGQPTETSHWVWCRTSGGVHGYLLKANMHVYTP